MGNKHKSENNKHRLYITCVGNHELTLDANFEI